MLNSQIGHVKQTPGTVPFNGVTLLEQHARDHMPDLLRDIADLVGTNAALRLAKRFGGRSTYIPRFPPPTSDLAACIGWEAAQTLGQAFGGDSLILPMARAIERLARDQALLADRRAGLSVRQLSLRHDLSERRIWEILATHRAD